MCPDYLYDVMVACWNLKPEQRPTFSVGSCLPQLSDSLNQRRPQKILALLTSKQALLELDATLE
jgi:hypothetical protein